jgi:hypothetical protein
MIMYWKCLDRGRCIIKVGEVRRIRRQVAHVFNVSDDGRQHTQRAVRATAGGGDSRSSRGETIPLERLRYIRWHINASLSSSISPPVLHIQFEPNILDMITASHSASMALEQLKTMLRNMQGAEKADPMWEYVFAQTIYTPIPLSEYVTGLIRTDPIQLHWRR